MIKSKFCSILDIDYIITEVYYDVTHTHITHVNINEYDFKNGSYGHVFKITLGNKKRISILRLIQLISDENKKITTLNIDGDKDIEIDEEVIRFQSNKQFPLVQVIKSKNKEYVKTEDDGIEENNLGSLPELF